MRASVIIPAYNAEKTIGKCLQAIQQQKTGFPFETIVVDDGSTDSTVQIVKGFKNVKLVKQKNAGPAKARNNGAKNSRADIVVFTDSDCIADKNWLQQMLEAFESSDIMGVQGRYKTKQREIIARVIQLEIEKRYKKMQSYNYIDFIGSYSAAYRKGIFEKMHGFDTSFPIASGEDTELSFRISEAGHKMKFNPNAIVEHRHPVSLAKYLKVKFFRAFWRTKIYGRHRNKMVSDTYTGQLIKAQAALFYGFAAAAAGSAFFALPLLYPAGLLALLLLSALPFSMWAAGRDWQVALLAPFLIILRTAAFDAGLVLGTINQLRRKR